ncbi:PepSY-like domain-containing protein [Flavisolibacter sp. BT320]|nr:PepSY-like domain-containing protein [Flavisolibacter longurius]
MKEKMIGLFVVAGLLTACSSREIASSKVPSVVLNAVSEKYPSQEKVDWKKVGKAYEAEIDLNDSVEVEIQVSENGQVIMQKQDIDTSELPAPVQATIKAQYPDFTIDDVERVTKGSVVYYQLELEATGKKDKKLVFSADGKEETSIPFWD